MIYVPIGRDANSCASPMVVSSSSVAVGNSTVTLETLSCIAQLEQNDLLGILCPIIGLFCSEPASTSVYYSSPPAHKTTVTSTVTTTYTDTATSTLTDRDPDLDLDGHGHRDCDFNNHCHPDPNSHSGPYVCLLSYMCVEPLISFPSKSVQ
jgi:hypothetical protein